MAAFDLNPSAETLENNAQRLRENEYPGRLIAMGRGAGNLIIQAYALMGRSDSSRDRIFVAGRDGVRTTSPSKSRSEMMSDPSAALIYYRAMARFGGVHVVSNGAQTSSVLQNIHTSDPLEKATKLTGKLNNIDLSIYEPDNPNFTPRIAGVIDIRSNAPTPFGLSIVRKDPDSEKAIRSSWEEADFSKLKEGVGYCLHTYKGDGNPLPSFDSDPYPIPFGASADSTTRSLWGLLNIDNRVAIVGTEIHIPGPEYRIIDRHNEQR